MKNWRTNLTAIIVIAGAGGCIVAFLLNKINSQELTGALTGIGLFGVTVGLFVAKDANSQ